MDIINNVINKNIMEVFFLSHKLLSSKEVHEGNRKNYNKKGFKTMEKQFSKNGTVQTIESNAYNESGREAKEKYKFE